MLNFQLSTEKDRREAAAIAKRRAFEEERKKRIFNPRARLIGIDHDVLQKQIEEKKIRDQNEKNIEQQFQQELNKYDEIALALNNKERQDRADVQKEINKFRELLQRPEHRREFYLNDPDWIKKQLPARLNDDDPRCGPSSAQKFQGEDRFGKQRAQIQREQTKAWLAQQIGEKAQNEKDRRAADEAYIAAVIARDQRAIELESMEKNCRKQLQEACLRFNKALATDRFCKEQKQSRETAQNDLAEISNALSSDFLTENPDVADSNLGPGRKIGFLYKGMTREELKEIRNAQLAQVEEAKRNKEMEKRSVREFDEYTNGTQKTIYLMDQELNSRQRQLNRKVAEENLKLAEEQRQRNNYLNKIVYSNSPSPAFFEQFNKGSR